MSDERATVRPVTLSRLAELTHACEDRERTTEDIETTLDVSHRRARGTILEAERVSLLREDEQRNNAVYTTTSVGEAFLKAIRAEDWDQVSSVLACRSPHYGLFLDALEDVETADLDTLLEYLEENQQFSPYSFNQTGIEVMADWAERLGSAQRNAFSGRYYLSDQSEIPSNFHFVLLDTYDDLEQTAGVDLRQRYLSIPRLREEVCERLKCTRSDFDAALLSLCQQNVGKVELSGAPMDTAAKDSALGIKQIELSDGGQLVSTSQSTEKVMAGVELYEKKYYYLAIHDHDVTFVQEEP